MKEATDPAHVPAALCALAAGCAAYAVLMHFKLPSLWYLPVARAWTFGPKPAALAMSWYGRTLGVFACAAAAGALGRALPRDGGRLTKACALLAAVALIVAAGVCVAANVDRPTKPLTPPGGRSVICDPAP